MQEPKPHDRLSVRLSPRFVTLVVALGIALALRCALLDLRPMHNDEAVNAIKFGKLWEAGRYNYDPNEHHGPSLFYATLAIARLTSSPDFAHLTETKLRLVTVFFGIGLIVLLPLVSDGLGRSAVLWAAFFTALSPAMVFYSRYYIHEMLLVFFAFLTLAAGWRYWRSRRVGWALLAGAGLGLMHATKETFVITVAAGGLALALNQFWNRYLDASGPPIRAPRINFGHLAGAAGVWCLVWLVLFSSFFSNASGPIDSIRTYMPWLGRAGGDSPHIHAWYFYFKRLLFFQSAKGPVWSEALIAVLAMIGIAAAFARKGSADANSSFVRFVALYTLLSTAAYTLIAYKTPWCLLSFWHGFVLLAGVGAVVITQTARFQRARFVAGVLIVAGALQLGAQAWEADGRYAADQRNPYVYAQTSPDITNLVQKLEEVATAHPQGRGMVVKVVAQESDYWPLPWYLRQFKNVGFWDELPPDPFAPVMLVSARLNAALDEKKTHVMIGYFQLRPEVFLEMYVELELWRAYLARRPHAEAEGI
jgi:uncharacterized protein (TIGR03663 family)